MEAMAMNSNMIQIFADIDEKPIGKEHKATETSIQQVTVKKQSSHSQYEPTTKPKDSRVIQEDCRR